jgi:hypothetical protein
MQCNLPHVPVYTASPKSLHSFDYSFLPSITPLPS